MALENMSIMIDSKLKKDFIKCVLKRYSNLEEGIIDLMRVYVERQNSVPSQTALKEKLESTVFSGDQGMGLSSRDIEKMVLEKTDEQIKAGGLAFFPDKSEG